MSSIAEVVDSLEDKIEKLLLEHQRLVQQRSQLEEEIDRLQKEVEKGLLKNQQLISDLESLKIANSMLGSNQYKRETKLKINALVRELDHCIAQLSE